MPMHDWSRVDACLFQDFRSSWISKISNVLNGGLLPDGCYALLAPAAVTTEEIIAAPGTFPFRMPWLDAPADDEMEFYRLRKSHVVIRRSRDHLAIAVLDITSAGDKASRAAIRSFAEQCARLIRHGVHLLVIDLFPPSPRDPQGIHKAIWDVFDEGEPFELPADKRLTLAAYVAGDLVAGIATSAYVEPIGVGDVLPDMPAYLERHGYVPVPLEATYQATWANCPADMRELVETGKLADEDE